MVPAPKGVEVGEVNIILEDKLFPDAVQGVNRIRVQREDDFTKKLILHGYLSPDEATESRLAELWGGGKFVVGLIAADEAGRQVIRRQNQIAVLGAYKRPAEIYGLQNSSPTVSTLPAAVSTAGNGMALLPQGRLSINETLDQLRLQQVLDIVAKGKDAPAAPAVPWERLFDMGLKVVEMFANNRRDPTADLREELARMREEMRRPANGPVTSGMEDMAKAINTMLDIKERITDPTGVVGEKKEDSGLMSLASDVLKMLMQRQGIDAGQSPAPASRISGKVEVPMAPRPTDPRPMWQQLLQQYRGYLVAFAQRGTDPEWVVETVLNLMPENLTGVLREFVQRPDAAAVAMQEIPELVEFPTFNDKLWAGLKSAVLGEEEEGGPSKV
jgi:hypothetical protein